MPFAIRPLTEQDVAQSAEIERDAFPTMFPSTSFRRELKNRMASYLVAWRRDGPLGDADEELSRSKAPQDANGGPLFNRLLHNAKNLWSGQSPAWQPRQPFIAAFLGMWYMTDEVHIVSIGVRRGFRGKGVGELVLIGGIEQALVRNARVVTLEVRVSNHVAQNLYRKYGFKERGVRKGYYTDDREDALIMTTDSIHVPPYPQKLRQLIHAHEQRWGRAERVLS